MSTLDLAGHQSIHCLGNLTILTPNQKGGFRRGVKMPGGGPDSRGPDPILAARIAALGRSVPRVALVSRTPLTVLASSRPNNHQTDESGLPGTEAGRWMIGAYLEAYTHILRIEFIFINKKNR